MNTTKKLLVALSIIGTSFLPLAAHASILGIATTGDLSKLQSQIDAIQSDINTIQNQIEGLQSFGDTINQSPALFETSLASAVNSSQTTLTLVSGTLRDGTTLSGNYCFTIDSGLTTTEYVCGVASGTTVTALTRGIGSDGITSYPSLEYPHRYGADVKITDFPQLQQQTRLLNGQGSFPNVLQYVSSTPTSSFTQGWQLIDKAYADALAFAGAPNGSPSAKGLYQEATTSTIASGTSVGTTGADLTLSQNTASTTCVAYNVIEANGSSTISTTCINGQNYSLGSTTVQSLVSPSSTFTGNFYDNASTSFSQFPTVASTSPTSSLQLAPKGYVDFFLGKAATSTTLSVTENGAGSSTSTASTSLAFAANQGGIVLWSCAATFNTSVGSAFINMDGNTVYSLLAGSADVNNFSTNYVIAPSSTAVTHSFNATITAGSGGGSTASISCIPTWFLFKAQ